MANFILIQVSKNKKVLLKGWKCVIGWKSLLQVKGL